MSLTLVTQDQWNEALAAGQAKREATGFLPDIFRLPWVPLDEYFGPRPVDYPPAAEEIEEALPAHDRTDRVQRALVASMIGAMIDATEVEANASDSVMLCTLLRNYLAVSYTAPDTLADLRWEIRAGLAARDLRRVSASCDMWLGFDPEAELLEIAVDSAFAAVCNLETGRAWIDLAWEESPPPEGSPSGSALRHSIHDRMFEWATRVHTRDPLYPPPPGPSTLKVKMWSLYFFPQEVDPSTGLPSEQDRQNRIELLRVCVSLLRRLGPECVNRSQHLVALSAWCDLALGVQQEETGLIAQAAVEYGQIADTTNHNEHSYAIRAPVDCFQHIGLLHDAEAHVQKWIAICPDSPEPFKRLAKLLYKQEHIPEAVTAFETYVRLKGDEQNDEWLHSLTLRLGLESQQKRHVVLEAAAERAAWASKGHLLAAWVHPWFNRLSPEATRKWWTGLWMVSLPEAWADLDARSIWEEAAAAFGEAVAMELRHSVFRLFLGDHPSAPDVTPRPSEWIKVHQDRATLGQMLVCLRQAKDRSPAGRALAEWLRQHKPKLLNYLGLQTNDELTRFNQLRGDAQHGTVTQAEARQVFEDAVGLLQHIVSG